MNNNNTVKPASDGLPSIANSLSTLLSAKQYGEIRNLAGKLGIDIDEISRSLFDCDCDYLSQSGAADVIKELENKELKTAAQSR